MPALLAEHLELARLRAVSDYSPPSVTPLPGVDELVRLLALTLNVPIAFVSIIERERRWLLAQVGVKSFETPRSNSLCERVLSDAQPLVLFSSSESPLVFQDPLVASGPDIRFYAAVPLYSPDRYVLGTVSVMAHAARTPSVEREALQLAASQVTSFLRLRRQGREPPEDAARGPGDVDGQLRLRAILDSMEEGVIVQDPSGVVISSNAAARRILRTSRSYLEHQSAHGPPIAPLVRRDGSAMPNEERPAAYVLRTGAAVTDVIMGLRISESKTTWISVNATPLRSGRKAPLRGCVMTIRDISEQVFLQEQLSQSLANYESLVASLPIGIAVFHGNTVRYVNRALVNILGYDRPSELLGRETLPFVRANSPSVLETRCSGMERGEHLERETLECKRPNGDAVLVEVVSMPSNFGGKPATLAIIRDVTESTRAREAQERSEARFRALVTSAPVGIFETDVHGHCLFANERFLSMTGLSREQALGEGWMRAVHPDDVPALQAERGTGGVQALPLAHEFRFASGGRVVYARSVAVALTASGVTTGYLGALMDLTELHAAQEALERSEASFRMLAHRAPIGIGVRAGSTVVFANPALARLYGFASAEELIGRNVLGLVAATSRPRLQNRLATLANEESAPREVFSIVRPDGGAGLLEVESINIDFKGVPSTMSLIRDVTELERARSERDAANAALTESLDQKETLLKEIHHRVKNNLQVIASLLRLGRSYVKDAAALSVFNDSIARLHSIALIHERLYQSRDLARIDMADYLKGLVSELVRANSTQVGVSTKVLVVGPIFFDIDRCVPIGLIVNELVSNALKHAFPARPLRTPVVVVGLSETEQSYELVVRDNGKGMKPMTRRAESLGLRIVENLTKQLCGSYRIEQDGGTASYVLFPKNPPSTE